MQIRNVDNKLEIRESPGPFCGTNVSAYEVVLNPFGVMYRGLSDCFIFNELLSSLAKTIRLKSVAVRFLVISTFL